MEKQKSSRPSAAGPGTSKTFVWIALASIISSIFVHGYLLQEHLQLRFGEPTGQSLCNINELFNCSAVAASRFSEFLGVPMALWGVAANVVLLLLLAWYPLTDLSKRSATRVSLILVSGFIALASVVMGVISAAFLSRYCIFCIFTYALSFITLVAIYLAFRKPKALSTKEDRLSFAGFTPLITLAIIAFLGSFIANTQLKKSYGFNNIGPFVQERIQDWLTEPAVQIQTVKPLVLGASAEQAKMTIVEFADYRCIHCKHAAPTLKAFVAAHPDVRLEFQAWPLDGECNKAIDRANGASCLLARAVQCAETVGNQGWLAHNYVFENQDRFATLELVKSLLPAIAESAGVPSEQLVACTEGSEAKTLIEQQAAVGTALKLQGTPSVYVNGRKLNGGQSIPVLTEAYKKINQ